MLGIVYFQMSYFTEQEYALTHVLCLVIHIGHASVPLRWVSWQQAGGFYVFICALEPRIFYNSSDWSAVRKSDSARLLQRWWPSTYHFYISIYLFQCRTELMVSQAKCHTVPSPLQRFSLSCWKHWEVTAPLQQKWCCYSGYSHFLLSVLSLSSSFPLPISHQTQPCLLCCLHSPFTLPPLSLPPLLFWYFIHIFTWWFDGESAYKTQPFPFSFVFSHSFD